MNIQEKKEKDNTYNVITHLSMNGENLKNSSLMINVTQVTSLERDTLLVKQEQDKSDNILNRIEKRKSTLKKVLEYTLGITFFTSVVYLISKGLYSRYVTQHNSLTLKGDNNTDPVKVEYAASLNDNVTESMVRKSRHLISKKNHPYRYYYSKNQPEKCSEINFLKKCTKEHQRRRAREYQHLILHIGYMPCFCPPPDNKKLKITPPPYNYTYTSNQPKFCQSKNIIKDCYKHQKKIQKETGKYTTALTFTVQKTKCYCPPLKMLIVNIIPPEEEKNIIKIKPNENNTVEILEKKQKRVYLPPSKKQTIENSDQSVTIKKIYDYSCVEESEKIDFSKALEIIANTLKTPISMMAEETSKVYHYNILRQGCPSEYSLKKLNEIASIADNFLNAFIQILPYNQGLVVTQNIISPLLMAISQELNNKPISIDLISEINTNVLFIFQDFVRSMTGNEMEDIKGLSDKTIQDKTEYNFNKKFKVNEEGLVIMYNNKEHNLNIDIENRPYIEEGNDIVFVGYNENDKKWDKIDNYYMHFYSSENMEHAKEYNMNTVHDDFMYNPENIKNSEEAEMFLSEHKFIIQHVFIANNIIPAYFFNLFSSKPEGVYITATVDKPKRIIIKSPFGFVFDKDSTDVSYSLGLYIENNIDGKILNEINRYSKIHNDKFSYDRSGNPHIKYNNIYYPVYPHDPESNIYSIKSEKYNEAVFITLKDSTLDFHESTNFNDLDFFKEPSHSSGDIKAKTVESLSEPYKIIPIKSKHQDFGFIDFSAYNNLLMNGKVSEKKFVDLEKIDSLIYKDKNSKNHYLMVNGIFYLMSENNNYDGIILIKNKRENKNNIKLYRHNDFLIQVKEQVEQVEYIKLNNCKNKRDLTEASCIPIYINRSLKRKLDNNRGVSININDDDVKPFYSHPGFFHKKNKDYYYYNGKFFEIKIISEDEEGNPLDDELIEVYSKSIFKIKRKIASFIFEEKEGRVELKEQDVLLAEKTGNKRDDMGMLLERKEYYRIPNIFNINDAINEVNRSNKLTIAPTEIVSDMVFTDNQIYYLCRHTFYENKKVRFNIIAMDQVNEDHDFYLWSAKIKVKNHLKYAIDILEKAISELKKPSEDVNEYLKIILGTDNKLIINKFSEELLKSLYNTLSKLDSNIIYLVSAIREPLPNSPIVTLDDNIQKELHHKRADEVNVKKGTFAFTTNTKEKNIYICTDKFYFIDPTHPDTIINTPNELNLAETLIHEATHAGCQTDDLYYMPHESDGLLKSIVKSKEQFIKQLPTLPEFYYHKIYKLARRYIESVPIYDQWKIPLLTDKDKLTFFISKDIGMLANVCLQNADFLTKMTKDIYRVNIIDKEGIQYYEKFLNAFNTGIVPIAGFLELDEDEIPADPEDTKTPADSEDAKTPADPEDTKTPADPEDAKVPTEILIR